VLSKFKRMIQVRQILAGLTGLLAGLWVNLVSDIIGAASWQWQWAIGILFLLSLGGNVWYWGLRPTAVTLKVRPPITVRLPQEQRRVARRGIVVVASLYTPQLQNSAYAFSAKERLAAAIRLDYRSLDFAQSNFAPIIEAINTHASRLQHCWIIGTVGTDRNAPGSNAYIPALVAYLRQEKALTCEFHFGEQFELALDDDALLFNKTHQLMQEIFNQARQLQLAATDIVADCTSGIRSIALGIVLSSLDSERDLQLIGVQYGPDGRQIGSLLPMIFQFEPFIQSEIQPHREN